MLKTNLIVSSIILKLLNDLINQTRVNSWDNNKDKIKSLFTFLALLKKLTRADYATFDAKKTFIFLQNLFIQALVFYYIDAKCHICIKIVVSAYAIVGVWSYRTFNNLK